MVTQVEIDAAEAAVEQAETALDVAEAHHSGAGSERSVQELRLAQSVANGARDRVRQLRAAWARERAAEARRAEAEENFPEKRRGALTRQLGDARDEAAHALASLERAAVEAMAAVAAYGAAVREASGELMAAGLRAGEGGPDGGGVDGSVHLGGEQWRGAEPGSVVAAVMQSVVAAYDGRHPLAQLRWAQLGGLVETQARAELLARAAGR
ncbi:MAG TPA: hypothetical protein VFQ05_06675 [Candidatus Eisenbacteria bacterium]|nr:hypothetical protein [Candidatus Eisenbacteria bacterium]